MAKITSTTSGNLTTYTITDVAGNTGTVTAPSSGAPSTAATISVSAAGGLLRDGLALLDNLLQMLYTGLRPNVLPNGASSFSN